MNAYDQINQICNKREEVKPIPTPEEIKAVMEDTIKVDFTSKKLVILKESDRSSLPTTLDKFKDLLTSSKTYTKEEVCTILNIKTARYFQLKKQLDTDTQKVIKRKVRKDCKKIKNNTYTLVLPTDLVNDVLALNLSKIYQDKAFMFLDLMIKKAKYKGELSCELMFTQTYFIKAFGFEYLNFIKPLIKNNIISLNRRYLSNNSYSNSFFILNFKYFYSDINLSSSTLCFYHTSSRKMIDKVYSTKVSVDNQGVMKSKNKETGVDFILQNPGIQQENDRYSLLVENFVENANSLKYDVEYLTKRINDVVNAISIKDFKVGEEIESTYFKRVVKRFTNGKTEEEYNVSLEYCKAKAKDLGFIMIEDKKTLYIVPSEESFITKKKTDILYSGLCSIKKLELGLFYATRNETNNRLDNNFTNMKKELVLEICNANGLVGLDAANCQYAILAHLIKEDTTINTKEDFLLFQELVETGTFYEYVKNNLGLTHKNTAKKKMMEIWFSSFLNNTTFKKDFKGLFPSVIEWIDNYKSFGHSKYVDNSNRFAILLQSFESEMFVDNLLMRCLEQDIFCITKHDSLIVKKEDEARVREIMKEYFNEINFKAKINNE